MISREERLLQELQQEGRRSAHMLVKRMSSAQVVMLVDSLQLEGNTQDSLLHKRWEDMDTRLEHRSQRTACLLSQHMAIRTWALQLLSNLRTVSLKLLPMDNHSMIPLVVIKRRLPAIQHQECHNRECRA